MKLIAVFLLITMAVIAIHASPVAPEEDIVAEHPRYKRFTCDVLGHWVGSSACASHCIGLGKKGGYCDSKQVCRCR